MFVLSWSAIVCARLCTRPGHESAEKMYDKNLFYLLCPIDLKLKKIDTRHSVIISKYIFVLLDQFQSF